MNIESMVGLELQKQLELLSTMDPATDEYEALEDEILKLMDRMMRMEELNIEHKKIDEDRKARRWDHLLRGIGIALPPTVALVAAFGFSVLERTEIVTSTPAREFMKRALRLN